jgi:hypothetical protein
MVAKTRIVAGSWWFEGTGLTRYAPEQVVKHELSEPCRRHRLNLVYACAGCVYKRT